MITTVDYYRWFDLQILTALELWFYPYYVLGKQDAWSQWIGSSLNGWKDFNICR